MERILVYKDGKVVTGKIQALKSSETVWVDIVNPTSEELVALEQFTGIPEAQIRAWLSGKKRPMAIDYQRYSVITFLAPSHSNGKTSKPIHAAEPCVMIISNNRNDFITIHRGQLQAIDEMNQYTEKHLQEIFKQRATFILFTVLNEIIEDYFDSLDRINETVRAAEELALNVNPENNLMNRVLQAKKSMILFHKALLANREIITAIEQEHLGFLDTQLLRDFRVLSSSITQLIEINSTYRDILNTTTEIHLSAISNNLNITMKKITSWGAIILVPSLIAGVFGMNFKHTPAFDWFWGFHGSLMTMVVSVVVMYLFFRKKDWL